MDIVYYTYSNNVVAFDKIIHFKKPIEYIITKENEIYILLCTSLDVKMTSPILSDLIENFNVYIYSSTDTHKDMIDNITVLWETP